MIKTLPLVQPSELPGVSIHYLPDHAGALEKALVSAGPGIVIPLHVHEVDAHMYIAAGSGRVLSANEDNGREVKLGDCVFFASGLAHGFEAGPGGLTFLSFNGGILQPDGGLDLAFVA